MRAFTNTKVSKQQLIEVLLRHKEADSIVQGYYYHNGRGCAVGCSLHDFGVYPRNHSAYQRLFGIPMVLAKFEDKIHEGLPLKEAKD